MYLDIINIMKIKVPNITVIGKTKFNKSIINCGQ